jgi:hypothetical protein
VKEDRKPIDPCRRKQILNYFNPDHLFNNIVEMECGGGKGLVIAVSAIILALWGFEVTCI